MRINNNLMAMNTHRQLGLNSSAGAKSIEKLSSGLRINRAGDDAAGLAISEKMRGQIRGLTQASRNAQDGISLIQTAEGALNETQAILQRMRELAVQSSNDTNVSVDRGEIQKEMNQLTSEINRIGNTTEFNTQKLINGERSATFVTKAGAYTAASGLGVNVEQTGTAQTYTAGNYVMKVERTSVVTAAATSGVQSNVTNTAAMTFENNKIHTVLTAGVESALKSSIGAACAVTSGATVTITYCANDMISVAIAATGGYLGTVTKDVQADANGDWSFDDFGVSFKITDKGNAVVGSTVVYNAANTAIATAAGTMDTLWTTKAGTAVADLTVLSASTTANAEAGTWTGTFGSFADAANSKITLNFTGADGTTYDAVLTMTAAGDSAQTFCANGVEFNMVVTSGGLSAAAGSVFEYKVGVKDQIVATLQNTSGTTITAATVATGYSGTGVATFTAAISGLSLTTTGVNTITNGTFNFEIVTAKTDTITDGSVNFQIGANQGQALNISIDDMRSQALNVSRTASGSFSYTRTNGSTMTADLVSTSGVTDGTSAANSEYALDVSTYAKATKAITVLNDAIEKVSGERSKLGSNQNRLEYTIKNLDTSAENLQASESRVRDVDMAKEMMNFTKNNILQQAAQAMLAQANQAPQGVLQLLR